MSYPWKPQEERQLIFNIGVKRYDQIGELLNRSPRAIEEHCKRHGQSRRRAIIQEHGMSTQECADALGTDRQRIQTWIRLGWLKARHHRITKRRLFTIEHTSLDVFLSTMGGLMSGLRPSAEWLECFTDAQRDLHARYINRTELAGIFCVEAAAFGSPYRLKKFGFPNEALRLEYRRCWYERAAIRVWLATAPEIYRTRRALIAFGLETT